MNAIESNRQHQISKYREIARKLLDEAVWIRRELPNLPFLKQQSAMKALLNLEAQARTSLDAAARLESEN